MQINFGMWRTALGQLVKMDSKKEWDALDAISKWLIATRSAVTTVTLYSCSIGGLLALRYGYFDLIPWLVITLGLFIAHGTNNILNDYTDFSRGIDNDNYFRTQYGVHPLVQGFWDKREQIRWFLVSGVLAFLSGIFALFYTNANPAVIGLFAFGTLILLFYTWPMKHWALGELSIFLVWGPILVAGVYLVLARQWTPEIWAVALAGVPYGLSVASINIAKHTDKLKDDQGKGVGTFPVRAGQAFARYTTMATILIAYALIIYLVATGYFSVFMLLILFAVKRAFYAIAVLSKPRPDGPPAGFEAFWPTWFSGFCFYHNRLFGNLFLLGILLDTISRLFAAQLPLPANVLGMIVLGIALVIAIIGMVQERAKAAKK